MSPPVIASIVLICVAASAALGLWLRDVLPEHHLAPETKEVVRLATGLVATIAALVLSLLISAAKTSFDRIDDELTDNAAKVLMLDRTLAEYGPATKEIRALLKSSYAERIDRLFSGRKAEQNNANGARAAFIAESIDANLWALPAAGATQDGLKARALQMNNDIDMTRALMHSQREDTIPATLLVVLVTWLVVIFATFSLFAPRNATVIAALFVCALSASGAILLILEMNTPFSGVINVSSLAMRETLSHLGE
ncbi:MAG TPA: hypothetical protein VGK20_07065 [Candidatus Binatia bacterium]